MQVTQPEPEHPLREFRLPGGETVGLETFPGLFSVTHVDTGTKVLLHKAPPPPLSGHLVDLGCGYGPITIALAHQSPEARVLAVDTDPQARELTARNARRLGYENVQVIAPDEAPADMRISAIYSNPPIKSGKTILHQMLTTWLDRLTDDGAAWLVVKKTLGSDSLITWLNAEGYAARKHGSRKGFRVVEARRC